MICVKYEHAPAGSDGSLTCCELEQRAMQFFFRKKQILGTQRIHVYVFYSCIRFPRGDERTRMGNDDDDESRMDDNDGGAPENG